jgi:hypothetical protein
MVTAGVPITFEARGTAGGWIPVTTDGVRNDIIDALGEWFTVQSVSVNPQGSFYEVAEWQFVARITVKPFVTYADADDAGSVVAHAIYLATGNLATIGVIGTQGASGEPATAGSIVDTITDAIGKVTTAIGQGIANTVTPTVDEAADELRKTLVIVGIVVVVAVVVMAGKTTKVGLA